MVCRVPAAMSRQPRLSGDGSSRPPVMYILIIIRSGQQSVAPCTHPATWRSGTVLAAAFGVSFAVQQRLL